MWHVAVEEWAQDSPRLIGTASDNVPQSRRADVGDGYGHACRAPSRAELCWWKRLGPSQRCPVVAACVQGPSSCLLCATDSRKKQTAGRGFLAWCRSPMRHMLGRISPDDTLPLSSSSSSTRRLQQVTRQRKVAYQPHAVAGARAVRDTTSKQRAADKRHQRQRPWAHGWYA